MDRSLLSQYRGKRLVVTGGTGMIGRQVVRLLADAGADTASVSLDRIEVHPNVEHIHADLADFNLCKDLTKGVDGVLHVAGIKGSVDATKAKPASCFVPLLMMNTNVLEAARVNNVPRVVYTSSIGAYPPADVFVESDETETEPPMDMFPGWAKRMAEMQIRAYKIQYGLEIFAIVRPCNVYGPGDNFDPETAMVIPTLMARIKRGDDPVIVWGDGSAVRDFAYAGDVAAGVIQAFHHGTGGRPVNLASGQGCSIRHLVETLAKVAPFRFAFDVSKPSGYPRRVMDISLARKLIGYAPSVPLDDGLRRTWDWYVANADEHRNKANHFKA